MFPLFSNDVDVVNVKELPYRTLSLDAVNCVIVFLLLSHTISLSILIRSTLSVSFKDTGNLSVGDTVRILISLQSFNLKLVMYSTRYLFSTI